MHIVADGQQVVGQIGEPIGQSSQSALLKGHIVGHGEGIGRDILHQALGQGAAGVSALFCQELLVFQMAVGVLNVQ